MSTQQQTDTPTRRARTTNGAGSSSPSGDHSTGTGSTTSVLVRQWRRYRDTPTRFVRVGRRSVAELLDTCTGDGRQRLYLVGDRPGGTAEGFRGWAWGELPPGWSPDGHYLESPMLPVLRWRHTDGRTVVAHRAAAWFGEGDYSPAEAAAALRTLLDCIRVLWRDEQGDIVLLDTPATFGRDLLLRALPEGDRYPTLPAEVQQLIRATSGQGRWELRERTGTLPALHGWDMRLAYAGMAWGLGGGGVIRDTRPDVDLYARGRYRVQVTVPHGWDHVGLVGLPDDRGRWEWPAEPGRVFETWVDGAELAMVERHGWHWRCLERIVLRDSDARPLDTWRDHLVTLRLALTDDARVRAEARGRAGARAAALERARRGGTARAQQLARDAVRAVVLHTFGALHGRTSPVTRWAPSVPAELEPAERASLRREAGGWAWREHRDAAWSELSRPEWSSAVWARTRARLLDWPSRRTGVLHTDPGTFVAMRQDAAYWTAPPGWDEPDPWEVGALRPTVQLAGPLDAPASHRELLALTGGEA